MLSSLQNDYAQKEERLHKLLEAKSPLKYLASAYADAVALVFTNSANYLNRKSHPAHSAAEIVKDMRKEAKQHAADAKCINTSMSCFFIVCLVLKIHWKMMEH